jgi:hypothetical protein
MRMKSTRSDTEIEKVKTEEYRCYPWPSSSLMGNKLSPHCSRTLTHPYIFDSNKLRKYILTPALIISKSLQKNLSLNINKSQQIQLYLIPLFQKYPFF